jgi:hypothetical protein
MRQHAGRPKIPREATGTAHWENRDGDCANNSLLMRAASGGNARLADTTPVHSEISRTPFGGWVSNPCGLPSAPMP